MLSHCQNETLKEFETDAIKGLRSEPKSLSCKYFYDQRGSQLFDRICDLDEYYLTRCELEIMADHAGGISKQVGPDVRLIELGSGSSTKTRLLLDQLIQPAGYFPVDVSEKHLRDSAQQLAEEYPDLAIHPICADFTQDFSISEPSSSDRNTVVYFPGSTVGNFEPSDAVGLLKNVAELSGPTGGLLIGIDLQKDVRVIEAAYNDSSGVTAAFNLNVLQRMNRELDADFDVDEFVHRADYNPAAGRIEMYLESRTDQSVRVAGESIEFAAGERICTEYSHKYTVDGFCQLAEQAGFALQQFWTDAKSYFAVLYLSTEA